MKRTLSFFLGLATLSLMGSCSKATLVQDVIRDEDPYREVLLSPTGGSEVRVLTFNESWFINSSDSWFQCSLANSSSSSNKEGTYVIEVKADVNRDRVDRSGVIYFVSAKGNTLYEIPVVQQYPYLNVSVVDRSSQSVVQDGSIQFNWNDSKQNYEFIPYSIRVNSNVDWRITCEDGDTEMFDLSSLSGRYNGTVLLSPVENNIGRNSFEAQMNIQAYMPGDDAVPIGVGVDSYNFDLSQKNLRFLINDQCEDANVYFDELANHIGNYQFTVDSEEAWDVKEVPSWLKYNRYELSDGIEVLNIYEATVNPGRTEREADVKLRSVSGAERTIHAFQNRFVFDLDTDQLRFSNNDLTERKIHFNSSSPWSIRNITVAESYYNIYPTSGNAGNTEITLSWKGQNLKELDDSHEIILINEKNSLESRLSVTQNRFVFDLGQNELNIPTMSTSIFSVPFESSGDWSLSSTADWIEIVSQKSGSRGSSNIRLRATGNNPNKNQDRIAYVKLISKTHADNDKTLEKSIKVVQGRFVFDIHPEKTSVPAFTNQSLGLDIECSGRWEIIDYPSWLKPDVTKSDNIDQLLEHVPFTIFTNSSGDSRTGKIVVKSKDNDEEKTVTITQEGFVFKVVKDVFNNLAPVGVSSQVVNLSCPEEAGWEIKSSQNWIEPQIAKGTGDKAISFKVADNPTADAREAVVTITNTSVSSIAPIKITFKQNPYEFSVEGTEFEFTELDESRKTIKIDKCSSAWTIDLKDVPWIHVSQDKGTGKRDVELWVDNNFEMQPREATIEVYSNLQHGTVHESKFKHSIKVKQSAFKFDTKAESKDLDSGAASFDISVECSGNWVVKNDASSWVSVTPMNGKGNGKVTVSVKANDSTSDREAKVVISVAENEALHKDITIKQKKKQ